MPLPAGVHTQAVSVSRPAVPAGSAGAPSSRSRRRWLTGALGLMTAVCASPLRLLARGQADDEALRSASGRRSVRLGTSAGVVSLPVEVYVARVLAGEADPRAPIAAQEALAIAIRTYAAANPRRHARDGFDLCDTTHCQVVRAATAATRLAALTTAGRILTYDGRPAEVFYSASCGGRTEAAAAVWPRADYPYMQGMVDDVHGDDEPWSVRFSFAGLQAALARAGYAGELEAVRIDARSASGRVARLGLAGLTPGSVGGDQLRHIVGPGVLRSTAFDLTPDSDGVRLDGRGYGHGVGLCVVGAGRRARRGESAEAILRAYLPGITVTVVA